MPPNKSVANLWRKEQLLVFLDFKSEDKGLWNCITNSGKVMELKYREQSTYQKNWLVLLIYERLEGKNQMGKGGKAFQEKDLQRLQSRNWQEPSATRAQRAKTKLNSKGWGVCSRAGECKTLWANQEWQKLVVIP